MDDDGGSAVTPGAWGRVSARGYYHGYLRDIACGENTMARRFARADLASDRTLDGVRLVSDRLFVLETFDGDVDMVAPPAWLRDAGAALPPVVLDRAGVRGRQMGKHTLYRFDDPRYGAVAVAMEFATPIRTMDRAMEECPEDLAPAVGAFHLELTRLLAASDGGNTGVVLVLGNTQAGALALLRDKVVRLLDER